MLKKRRPVRLPLIFVRPFDSSRLHLPANIEAMCLQERAKTLPRCSCQFWRQSYFYPIWTYFSWLIQEAPSRGSSDSLNSCTVLSEKIMSWICFFQAGRWHTLLSHSPPVSCQLRFKALGFKFLAAPITGMTRMWSEMYQMCLPISDVRRTKLLLGDCVLGFASVKEVVGLDWEARCRREGSRPPSEGGWAWIWTIPKHHCVTLTK